VTACLFRRTHVLKAPDVMVSFRLHIEAPFIALLGPTIALYKRHGSQFYHFNSHRRLDYQCLLGLGTVYWDCIRNHSTKAGV